MAYRKKLRDKKRAKKNKWKHIKVY
jgi:hypothetical protein